MPHAMLASALVLATLPAWAQKMRLATIAPKDGVLNVWVGPRSDPSAAKPVTNDTKRGIRQHFWAYDNKHVLYIQDEGGDENWHLYATDVVAGTTKDLTPYKGVQAQVVGLSWKKPGVVAVGLNDRVARVARPLGSEHRHRQARADRTEHAGVRRLRPRPRSQAEARAARR